MRLHRLVALAGCILQAFDIRNLNISPRILDQACLPMAAWSFSSDKPSGSKLPTRYGHHYRARQLAALWHRSQAPNCVSRDVL